MKTLNEKREAIALRFMRDDQYEQVKCDGEDILVRRYACNDFIRLGRVEDVYRQMLERDAAPRCWCGGVIYNGHHCENGHLQERRS